MAIVSYQTDNFALGFNVSPRAGVYPQVCEFSTSNSPGGNLPISALLGVSDMINLFYIPTPGILHGYRIEFGKLDTSVALVLTIEDGLGNAYQTGVSISGASTVVNDTTAAAGFLGQVQYTSPAAAFLRARVTTASGAAISAAGTVKGIARYRSM